MRELLGELRHKQGLVVVHQVHSPDLPDVVVCIVDGTEPSKNQEEDRSRNHLQYSSRDRGSVFWRGERVLGSTIMRRLACRMTRAVCAVRQGGAPERFLGRGG